MDLARYSAIWMRLESEFIQYASGSKAKVKKPEEGKGEEAQRMKPPQLEGEKVEADMLKNEEI